MSPRPATLDESPLSEFITKMRDAHRRRLAAVDQADKRAIEREMKAFMTQYLGRDAWEASVAAQAHVPRGTRRDRRCHAVRGRFEQRGFSGRDGKMLATGEEVE